MREHPAFAARAMFCKLVLFWNDFEISDNQDQYLLERDSWVLRLPLLGFGGVAPLALLGVIAAARTRRAVRLLGGFVILYCASVVAFFIFSRYRIQVVPALLPLAAVGAAELVARIPGRRSERIRPPSRRRMRWTSSARSRMTSAAGVIPPTSPTRCPASRLIEPTSPLASAVGGAAQKRGTGTRCPPKDASPITASSARCSCPRASFPSHCSTNGVRSARCGAFGQPPPNSMVRTVSSSVAATTFSLYNEWAAASGVARNRVPRTTPSAPSASAATTPRASAIPPAATTGVGATASTTRGTRTIVATWPATWPPASTPCATMTSTPARAACRAAATDPT